MYLYVYTVQCVHCRNMPIADIILTVDICRLHRFYCSSYDPVKLTLQEGKLLSAMIRGLDNGGEVRAVDYEPGEVEAVLENFLGPVE